MKVLMTKGDMISKIVADIEKPEKIVYFKCGSGRESKQLEHIDPIRMTIDESLPNLNDKVLTNAHLILAMTEYGDHIIYPETMDDLHADESQSFGMQMQQVINAIIGNNKNVNIDMRYKRFTKRQLVKQYATRGHDLQKLADETYDCETGNDPCGICNGCIDKWIAIKLNGVNTSDGTRDYLVNEVVPRIKRGEYTDKNKDDIMEATFVPVEPPPPIPPKTKSFRSGAEVEPQGSKVDLTNGAKDDSPPDNVATDNPGDNVNAGDNAEVGIVDADDNADVRLVDNNEQSDVQKEAESIINEDEQKSE